MGQYRWFAMATRGTTDHRSAVRRRGSRLASALAWVGVCGSAVVGLSSPAGAANRTIEDRSPVVGSAGSYDVSNDWGESSGMVASRRYPGYHWMIQDSGAGTKASIVAVNFDNRTIISTAGTLRNLPGFAGNANEIEITNVTNTDWESLAIDSKDRLWIADSGANAVQRTTGRFYVLDEPEPLQTTPVEAVESYDYQFPGGGFPDVEAVFTVHDTIYLITKQLGAAVVYRFTPVAGEVSTLVEVARFGDDTINRITGADLSEDGQRFAVVSQREKRLFVWRRTDPVPTSVPEADQFVRSLVSAPPDYAQFFTKQGPVGWSLQVEAVALPPAGRGYAVAMMAEGTTRYAMYVRPWVYEGQRVDADVMTCSAVKADDGTFTVTWAGATAADYFVVSRSVDGNGPHWRGRTAGNASSWIDSGNVAPSGSTVTYQVQANLGGSFVQTALCD